MLNLISKKHRIRQKLFLINLVTIGIVLLLSGSALLINIYVSFRNSLVSNLATQANILSNSCTAPLTFNDQRTASQDLHALKASRNITRAIIYGKDSKVFAEYRRAGSKTETPPATPATNGHLFRNGELHVFQTVELDGETIGSIYLASDLVQLHSLMTHYGLSSFVAIALVFGISFILLNRLQRVITEPLFELATTMKTVSLSRDYTLKAEVFSEDEIGFLANGFNEMLEQIRERDKQLQEDIERRIRAETLIQQEKEFSDTIIESFPGLFYVLDRDGRFVRWNRHAPQLLGLLPRQMIDLQATTLFREEDRVMIADRIGMAFERGQATAEGRLLVREQAVRDYFFTARRIDIEGKSFIIGYGIDITDRRVAEESVRRLNEELERKVDERTRQLLDIQEELVRNEKLAILGQLSGSVGHELRNPLGVMSNAVYFLKIVNADADETTREYLDIINHEIDTSQQIISDLLDFARTKTPQKKGVTVAELIRTSMERCVLPENVAVLCDIPETLPTLMVDPLQMGQVLQNLITNAVQAMREGGELRIAVRLDRNSMEISIEDSGEGISPENLKKLFQPLFTTKPRGIGLGLTVCRNLTEANCGAIKVESELGKGTCFVLSFPIEG